MKKRYFIGVDGGGTKSRLQLEDEHGNLLAKVASGPASIRWSVSTTWESVLNGFYDLCEQAQIDPNNQHYEFYAGMGLAGCEIPAARDEFLKTPNPFKKIILDSDGYTACLGAHNDHDGSIITVGTGVVGFTIENNVVSRVGGWGFPHDDKGGGAWLGVEAARLTFQWIDGRAKGSPLLTAIYERFENDPDFFSTWANNAHAKQFASLAPIIIDFLHKDDPWAIALIKEAATQVDLLHHGLVKKQQQKAFLPCSLFGGIAPFIQPYIGKELASCLVERKGDPAKGAIIMVKKDVLGHK